MLVFPFSAAFLRFSGGPTPQHDLQETYYPQSADALTLTVAGRTVWEEAPCCFTVCRIDPAAGEILLCVLPPETLVEDGGRFDTAASVWQREGGARGSEALARALGYPGDRWLDLDADALRRICNAAGALDYTLEQPLVLPDGTTALTAGRQLLDGTKLALLMAYGGQDEASRLTLIGDLLREGIAQRLPMLGEGQLLTLFETAVNYGKSDLAVGDFESRRRALTHLATRPLSVRLIGVSGEYGEGGRAFLPSAQTLQTIETQYTATKQGAETG